MSNLLPRVAAVHDISGYGRCSLTVAIPVISAMGAQVCPLPTAVLSNHTAYPTYYFADFTEHMVDYYSAWQKLDLSFDAIYTGFLGSEGQVDIVRDFLDIFHRGNLFLMDPVMGDKGNIYATYTPSLCEKMRALVERADIITPNLTEASLLLDMLYPGENISIEQAAGIVKKLAALGPKAVVLTGIRNRENMVANLAYEAVCDKLYVAEQQLVPYHFDGTGDLFASVLCGSLLNNGDLTKAVKKATDFVYEVTSYTYQNGGAEHDGVMFEPFLRKL